MPLTTSSPASIHLHKNNNYNNNKKQTNKPDLIVLVGCWVTITYIHTYFMYVSMHFYPLSEMH